jgi:hypothetical protein
VYGPNYWLQPPFAPLGTIPPRIGGGCQQPIPAYPTHPFARSPRDFFMMD